MSKEEKVNLEILEEFKKQTEGKWEPELIDKTVKEVTSLEDAPYYAEVFIDSVVIKQHFQVSNTDYGVDFDGWAWGAATPGIGISIGRIFTRDLDKLLSDTTNFWFAGTSNYLGLYFYNDDNVFLGQFQGASVSLVAGAGSGPGHWG